MSCRPHFVCWPPAGRGYGCRSCGSAILQAPAPARIVEGGIPTEALIAQVLVSKYADHLPLYRKC
jgi:transposase